MLPIDSEPTQDAPVWVKPGHRVLLRVECARCEEYRWRAVNPYRNVRRALRWMDEGDLVTARERLQSALEDLEHLCQYDREEGKDG